MDNFKKYMIARLKEKSTYIGISACLASIHYKFTDALIDDAASFFIILCGLAIAFTRK